VFRSIETLLGRGKTGIRNLDRLQKPPILHDKPKVKLKTSKISPLPIMIQLCIEICSRKKHREGRWTKQETRLVKRDRKG